MGKNKIQRFEEMKNFSNAFQPRYDELLKKNFYLKGKWNEKYFNNNNPIILELGCGKGEYTLGLAKMFPEKNFIGIDIKGARMWKGAKEAYENNITNAAFLRTRIEFIASAFEKNEISEIWITFPDPQMKKRRTKKRLTSPFFLNLYKNILTDNHKIHLKTDNKLLYDFTLATLQKNNCTIHYCDDNIYNNYNDIILNIKTFYEQQFLNQGINIKYIEFSIPKNKNFTSPDEEFGI